MLYSQQPPVKKLFINMSPRNNRFIKSLLTICSCLCLNSHLQAATSKLESDSPFLPPGYSKLSQTSPKPTPQPNSPFARDLEFRGVVQLDGTYHFSLFKNSENKGYWISEDVPENGIQVNHFDASNMQITVTVNGRSEQLSLMPASESPLPVPVAAQPPSPAQVSAAPPPALPPGIQLPEINSNGTTAKRTIPRRRVIVPNKNR